MTGFVYRASWPIVDDELPISALVVEASAVIDAMAAAGGARIVGRVRWTVDGRRLLAEAPALPLEVAGPVRWGSIARHAETIAQLAGRGLTDREIADLIGCSESGVAKARQRRGVPGASERRRRLGRGEAA